MQSDDDRVSRPILVPRSYTNWKLADPILRPETATDPLQYSSDIEEEPRREKKLP